MTGLNLAIFRAVNGMSDAWSPFLTFFSVAVNQLWVKLALAIMAIGMMVAGGRARRTAIQALIAFPIANGLTDLWKHGLPEPRPFQEIPNVLMRVGMSNSAGTASAHAANMAAVAFVFAYGVRAWGVPWVLIALLTGFSRVYVGAHYPYQVLLGWSMGILAGLAVTQAWAWIVRQREANPSQ